MIRREHPPNASPRDRRMASRENGGCPIGRPDVDPGSFWSRLPQPIIGLAPMDGVTDAAFRLIVARQGPPDVTFTEFTSVTDVCRGPERVLTSLLYSDGERPVVAQLFGKDPDLFYQAAHVVCELGFDGLDINMGCPSRNVAASGSGAALIRTPDLAHAIMRAARQGIQDWAAGQSLRALGLKSGREELIHAMNRNRSGQPDVVRQVIPLSVKTRLGYDCVVVEDWITHLLDAAPAAISLHGRTLAQLYRGQADWEAINRAAQLARQTSTLLLGNGDVDSLEEVVRRVAGSAVHGILVGRGALGEPWLFRQKAMARARAQALAAGDDAVAGGLDASPVVAERFAVMLEHARAYEAVLGRDRFPRVRKHLGWYCKGFPGAAAVRARLVQARSSDDVETILADYNASARGTQAGDNVLDDSTAPLPLSCA